MTTKVRIEYVTLRGLGAVGGESVDQPDSEFAVQELSATGGTASLSAAVPYFGLLNGLHVTAGVARITAIYGAAIVAAGVSPAPTETSGFRIAVGDKPLDISVQSGWYLSVIEAADAPGLPGGGAVSDAAAESSLAAVVTAMGSSNTALSGVNAALATLATHADAVASSTTLTAIQTALGLIATHADETTANTALAAIQASVALGATHSDASATNTALASVNSALAALATHGDLVSANAVLAQLKADLDAADNSVAAVASEELTGQGFIDMPFDSATYTAGRWFQAECSGAGNVKVTAIDNSTRTIPLQVGLNIFGYAITKWTMTGVTSPAMATFCNVK